MRDRTDFGFCREIAYKFEIEVRLWEINIGDRVILEGESDRK